MSLPPLTGGEAEAVIEWSLIRNDVPSHDRDGLGSGR
jgi:hypothetical protein